MSRRKKPKTLSKITTFLSEEYAAIQEALETTMAINFPTKLIGSGSPSKVDKVTSYYKGGGGGVTNLVPSCEHDGSMVVFAHENKKLFAASRKGLKPASGNWELIIDLAGNVKTSKFVESHSTERYKVLNIHDEDMVKSEILSLDWFDMQPPPVGYNFWVDLWELMPTTSVIACMGGHGRTGTCLAALMIVTGVRFRDAVKLVRKNHCDKAIESISQMKYLHGLGMERIDLEIELSHDDANTEALEKELQFEIDNVPDHGGSKGGTTKCWTVLENEKHLATTEIQGTKYIKECIKCNVFNCAEVAHQAWILPEDSTYYVDKVKVIDTSAAVVTH